MENGGRWLYLKNKLREAYVSFAQLSHGVMQDYDLFACTRDFGGKSQ